MNAQNTHTPGHDHTPIGGGEVGQPQLGIDSPLQSPQTYPTQTYPNQPYPNPYAANAQRVEEDPGKVLGIVSLVATLSTFLGFNFIGPVIGIITGHMARKRSQEAGYGDNEMGKWGFILGLVFLGLLVLGWALGISFGIVGGLAGLMAG